MIGRCKGVHCRKPPHEPADRPRSTQHRGNMMTCKSFAVAMLAATAVLVVAAQVRAGGDKVAFPENFRQGVMYTIVDRADNKQYRELCVPRAGVEAPKKGEPLPSGTVITIVQYKA